MRDPSVMQERAQMMKDPENQKAVKEMMAHPEVQAKRAREKMASNGMPDISKLMQDPNVMAKAQAMAKAMYGGENVGGSAEAAEIARLRAENAALRQGVSV